MRVSVISVVVVLLGVCACVSEGATAYASADYDNACSRNADAYEQRRPGGAKDTTGVSVADYLRGNCFSQCSKNSDCGNAINKQCTTCVNGRCSCTPRATTPCLNTTSFLYQCLDSTVYTPCGLASACVDKKTEFCCDASVSLLPQTCDFGYKCAPSPVYGTVQAVCADVDECKQNASICGAGYTCANTVGSYTCTDINECADTTRCGSGYTCVNTKGSYKCVDVDECATQSTLTRKLCPSGYTCANTVGSYNCVDINECATTPDICGGGFTCANTNGSYVCNDINECKTAKAPCPGGNFTCSNTNGSYTCDDVNECVLTPNICGGGFTCANTNGSYTCNDLNECVVTPTICGQGFTCNNTIGSYVCTDIDECQQNICGGTGFTCNNTNGGYICEDIDECAADVNPCNQYNTCSNSYGGFLCIPLTFFITSRLNGYVVEPINNTFSEDASLLKMTAKVPGKLSQQWMFTNDSFLENKESGLVMDVQYGSVFPGVNVVLWYKKEWSWAGNQHWIYDATTLSFKTQAGDEILDIFHADPSDGATLCVYTRNGGTNQQFIFEQIV